MAPMKSNQRSTWNLFDIFQSNFKCYLWHCVPEGQPKHKIAIDSDKWEQAPCSNSNERLPYLTKEHLFGYNSDSKEYHIEGSDKNSEMEVEKKDFLLVILQDKL